MAVWDQFLTERDKQLLAERNKPSLGISPAKRESRAFGKRPALLIVDDYYGALGDKPLPILESIKAWPQSCGLEGWEAIYKTKDLLEAARANHIPVVYCTAMDEFPSAWGRKPGQSPADERQRMHNKIVEEIAPRAGELVIYKAAPSAFFGTLLSAHFIYIGVDTIIACGETTSGCVRASVVDGCAYGFRMGVVEECTFDRTQASHAINLFDLNQKYANVISLAEAIEYLQSIGTSGKG